MYCVCYALWSHCNTNANALQSDSTTNVLWSCSDANHMRSIYYTVQSERYDAFMPNCERVRLINYENVTQSGMFTDVGRRPPT